MDELILETFDSEDTDKNATKLCLLEESVENSSLIDDKLETTILLHKFCAATHLASASFLDEQLKPLRFRIGFLTQLLRGVEADMVRNNQNPFYVKVLVKFRRNLVSTLNYFFLAKNSVESASWEHKSLQMYHEQVAHGKKLDRKLAELIKVTMNRLQAFRSKAQELVGKGETVFDGLNDGFEEVCSLLACAAKKITSSTRASSCADEGIDSETDCSSAEEVKSNSSSVFLDSTTS